MENYCDPDIEKAFAFFAAFMSPEGWAARKARIEEAIEIHHKTTTSKLLSSFSSLPTCLANDQIGWYLYLIECLQGNMLRYEPTQGARVAPIFMRIGKYIEDFTRIDGIVNKTRDLIKKDKNTADSVLFEMLTALLWQRQGYQVSFLKEAPPLKQPDLLAVRGGERWYIECKRLMADSTYHQEERAKWNTMLMPLDRSLLDLGLVIDIVFHVPLTTLTDDFLMIHLLPLLHYVDQRQTLCHDETWTVTAKPVNYLTINTHLAAFLVRHNGTQLVELISEETDSHRSFSYGIDADYVRLGGGKGFDVFVDCIHRAYGIFWSCDAPEAIDFRARDFYKQITDARDQLPENEKSIIHIGVETYNGEGIETRRFEKVLNNLSRLDLKGKPVHWVKCNFFQCYAPPDGSWTIDESNYQFKHTDATLPDPLSAPMMILPEGESEEGLHWFKPQP